MSADAAKRFIGLSSFEVLAMFRRGLFYAYLTIYLRHYLGMSVTATTLFATFPMLVNVLCQTFIWGHVSDHFQLRRTLIASGETLAALGTVAVWYFHRLSDDPIMSGYIIIFGLTIVELFWSMSNISWSALISDLYTEGERGSVQGRLSSMGGIGRILGIWVGGVLYEGMDKHLAGWGFYNGSLFFVAAGVMLVSTLPLCLLPEGGLMDATAKIHLENRSMPDGTPDSSRLFVVFLIGMILINFGRNSIGIIFPQYLSLESGLALDGPTLGNVLNAQSAAIVAFGWIVGWLCRKMGTAITLLAASILAVIALVIVSIFTLMPLVYLSSFMRGVADTVILATAYELAAAFIPPAQRARRFAWFNATFFLSWGLPATLIAGPLVDFLIACEYVESTAYRVSFGVAAGLVFTGLMVQSVLIYFLKTRRGFKA